MLIIAAAGLSGFGAVCLGFIPPPHATTLIWIHGERLDVTRNRLRAQPREFLAEILREGGVTSGFIAVTPSKKVMFSRKIPDSIRQRLRNVLLNI